MTSASLMRASASSVASGQSSPFLAFLYPSSMPVKSLSRRAYHLEPPPPPSPPGPAPPDAPSPPPPLHTFATRSSTPPPPSTFASSSSFPFGGSSSKSTPPPRRRPPLPPSSEVARTQVDVQLHEQRMRRLMEMGDLDEAEDVFRDNVLHHRLSSPGENRSYIAEILTHAVTTSAPIGPSSTDPSRWGSDPARRAIEFLHFLRINRQPRTSLMYECIIERCLYDDDVDLAARVYAELVEEWAWEEALGEANEGDRLNAEVPWLNRPPERELGVEETEQNSFSVKELFGIGLRWNHRAEAQRRATCWAPDPILLNLQLRRFPLPRPTSPPSLVPFPEDALLALILRRVHVGLDQPLADFKKSAGALAILANTVLSRTLPIKNIGALVNKFSQLPRTPAVYAPVASPDRKDDTTAFAHVNSALKSLIYGLAPGSLDQNASKYKLQFVSEESARSLLDHALLRLRSPLFGGKVLSYLSGQGLGDSPWIGPTMMRAGTNLKLGSVFRRGLELAMSASPLYLLHRPAPSPEISAPSSPSDVDHHSASSSASTPPPSPSSDQAAPFIAPASSPDDSLVLTDSSPGHSESSITTSSTLSPHPTSLTLPESPQSIATTVLALSQAGHDDDHVQKTLMALAERLRLRVCPSPQLFLALVNALFPLGDVDAPRRPIRPRGDLYQALIAGLLEFGHFSEAEELFFLSTREADAAPGDRPHVRSCTTMMQAYAQDALTDNTDPMHRRSYVHGWNLYRGVSLGSWHRFDLLVEKRLAVSRLARTAWYRTEFSGTRQLEQDASVQSGVEATFPSASTRLRFYAAVLALVRTATVGFSLSSQYSRTEQIDLICSIRDGAIAQVCRRDPPPPMAEEDIRLSRVVEDLEQKGLPVPLGVLLQLAPFPDHPIDFEGLTFQRSSPERTLGDHEHAWATATPMRPGGYEYPKLQKLAPTPATPRFPALILEEESMDELAKEYTASYEDELDPTDWPLLVWQSLDPTYSLPSHIRPPPVSSPFHATALLFTSNFALSTSGSYLLHVGRDGTPTPFIPSEHRVGFLERHWEASAMNGQGYMKGLKDLWSKGWWPGIRGDIERMAAEKGRWDVWSKLRGSAVEQPPPSQGVADADAT